MWPRLRLIARRAAPATSVVMPTETVAPIDLRKFERFTPAEVSALPRKLRRAVQADRKARMTSALERFAARR